MPRTSKQTVAIAGAGGFIGTALARELAADHRVICLSRRDPPARPAAATEWRRCDLFSLFECERALAGADAAFYLVHSMLPSAHLTQGTFQDLDLISADNFARAAARVGLRRIIYLGGMIPDQTDLSRHILSRSEVERTLGAYGVPVTTLRAGIVIGLRSSSYGMFRSVLERVPVIPCPSWSASLIQPVALSDVIRLLRYCLERPQPLGGSHDIGSSDIMNYRELLERSARLLGRRRLFVGLPWRMLCLSKAFLALISGYPRQLVSPLVESLKHSLVSRDLALQRQAGLAPLSFAQAVQESLDAEKEAGGFRAILAAETRRKRRMPPARRNTVRSVQRIPLPQGKSARWLALRFTAWLPQFFRSLLKADIDAGGNLVIRARFLRLPLLELHFSLERSPAADRQLFYISGGLLARKSEQATRRPRLEFREVLNGSVALVAIHDYQPTLPWPLYNLTQARAHLWVMRNFARAVGAGRA
ncbi:MAG: NAD-dependent epimerase/dehydratase family protein [Acidobacteria bacterium]|jgi:uncharacterized protein YbjT (DUF2867 family)|nr:NAD-dependent epimerase/dehydratase family protein [Acidobacteriota bacterium]